MLFKQEEKSTKGRGQDGVEGQGAVCSLIYLKGCHVGGGVDLFFVIPEERAGATGYKVCFDGRQEFLTAFQTYLSPNHQLLSPTYYTIS